MHSFHWLVTGSIFLIGGCTRALEGAPCPCAAGYECCAVRNTCQPLGQSCALEGAGGSNQAGRDGGSAANAAVGAATAGGSAGTRGEDGGTRGEDGGTRGEDAGTRGEDAGMLGGSAGMPAGGGGGSPEPGGGAGGLGGVNEPAFVLVPTQHNDNARTGANLNETALTVATVNHPRFGELSRRPLRGAVFAQPLVAPARMLPAGGELDLVYVATMGNVVYALDARKPERPPVWSRTLGPSVLLPDPIISIGRGQIWHEIGILGTPVLSVADGALYAVAATKEGDVYAHHVHKLDLSTGNVLASAAIADVDFVNAKQAQRSALTLAKGVLYVPFGDYDPGSAANGWVFTFDVNLSPLGIIRLGNPSGSGVTMSGQGPAADDSGAIFLTTSPGFLTENEVSSAIASRVLALPNPTGAGMSELFGCSSAGQCPSTELGSSGPLLLPNSNQLLVAGQRDLYLLSRGARAGASAALVQKFRGDGSVACDPSSAVSCAAMPSSPVYWPGSGPQPKPRVFAWSPSDRLRSFGYDVATGHFCLNPTSDNSCSPPSSAFPVTSGDSEGHALQSAAHLSVSSQGSERGSAMVWAAHPYTTDSLRNPDGILRAFDAENLTLSWSTEAAGTPLGPLAPGATPTVSGGRVFVGTADGISKKRTFWDTPTAATPAVANFADKSLVLAWTVSDPPNSGFKLRAASDGFVFGEISSVNDTLFAPEPFSSEPALAADDSHVYLGWTAWVAGPPRKRSVKVAVSADPSFDHYGFMTLESASGTPELLSSAALSAPALAYGNHRLFLAYHEEDKAIVVLSSQDGSTFDPSTRVSIPLDYPSYRAPALAYLNGKLYVTSTDLFQHVKLFVSADDGATFTGPTLLPILSEGHPALLMLSPQAANEPDLHLLWSDTTNTADPSRIKIASVFAGDFLRLARSHEFLADKANYSISAARFKDAWYVAWMGVGDTNHPNVARYSPGELVTFGLGAPR